MDKNEIKNIEEFIGKLPQREIDEINAKEIENTKTQYTEFKEKFAKGECYICNLGLNVFSKDTPCVHGLLNPDGFKKKNFKSITQKFTYSNIDSYLRWVANQESFLKNINDLSEEKKGSMMFEHVIKYKNFEWTFSCSKTDFEGHKNRRQGRYPHYHFQMRVDSKPFVDFSDVHIPLTHHDMYVVRCKRNEIKNVSYTEGPGAGMEALFQNSDSENILKHAKTTEDFDKAAIHTTYIIQADSGKTISRDEVADLIEESKKTKTPLWNLLPKLKNTKKTAIVSPGEGVPKIFHRKDGHKKDRHPQ